MNTGLMWFDNDPKKPLDVKVAEAAKRFYEKYGRIPQTCRVNPKMLPAGVAETNVNFITVKSMRAILPWHVWIGCE